MATANFHARIARIEKAQAAAAPRGKPANFRTPGMAGVGALRQLAPQRRRHPALDHLMSAALGIVLGALLSAGFVGLSQEGALWGPLTVWNDIVYYPVMIGFGVAPLFLIVSVFVASRRPSFALFSLGYASGITVPLII